NAAALHLITLAGAGYLLSLGISIIRRPAELAAPDQPTQSTVRHALRGAAVSGLNPKGLLLFFAILPQFVVAKAAWPAPVQLATLGAFHIAVCTVVYLSVALAANRVLASRPGVARLIGRVSGGSMILVGVGLGLERIVGA